jgi:hypothetical protein
LCSNGALICRISGCAHCLHSTERHTTCQETNTHNELNNNNIGPTKKMPTMLGWVVLGSSLAILLAFALGWSAHAQVAQRRASEVAEVGRRPPTMPQSIDERV